MHSTNLLKNKRQKAGYLLKETFNEFVADNTLQLSAALSCYILFSLTPLLIIIISLCGIFFGEQAVRGEVFAQINGLVGTRAAFEIQETIKTVSLSTGTPVAGTISIILSLIASSAVFAEIQGSINFIWGIKTKPKRGLIKFIINRLMSFSVIASTGLLLFVGLTVNSLMDVFNKRLIVYLPEFNINFYYAVNILILFLLIILLFTIIFKILPDGKIAILDCLIGATFTAVLFMLGKFAVGTYFGSSAVGSIYGAAGTLILILAWIYYSSIIFYLGAQFTKVYAHTHGKKIFPNKHSVRLEKIKS